MTSAKEKLDPKRVKGPEAFFKTSPKAEAEGVELDYGDFWIKVTRAGASNVKFKTMFEKAMQPHRRAIANGTMNNDVADRITREVWARSIVVSWGSKLGDTVIPFEGQALPFSAENCIKVFEALPDFFIAVREDSMRLSLFQDDELETDAGN